MKRYILATALLFAGPALAQQPPSSATQAYQMALHQCTEREALTVAEVLDLRGKIAAAQATIAKLEPAAAQAPSK